MANKKNVCLTLGANCLTRRCCFPVVYPLPSLETTCQELFLDPASPLQYSINNWWLLFVPIQGQLDYPIRTR
jgi:hypothetical protein